VIKLNKSNNPISETELNSIIDQNDMFLKIKSQLFNNKEKKNYDNFFKSLKQDYQGFYFRMFFLTITTIIIISLIGFFLQESNVSIFKKTIFFLFASLVIGIFLYNIQQAVHLGQHFNLSKNRSVNDLITNFLGLFTGIEVTEGRRIHFKHHKLLSEDEDPENSYMNRLNLKKIVKFFSLFAVFNYGLNVLFIKKKNDDDEVKLKDKIINFFSLYRFFSIIFNLLILYVTYQINYIITLAWAYGLLAFCPFFCSLLNMLEHGNKKIDSKKNKILINRIFSNSILTASE